MTIHYIQCIAASAIYLLTLYLVIKQNKKWRDEIAESETKDVSRVDGKHS